MILSVCADNNTLSYVLFILQIFSVNKTYNIPLRFIITPAEVENNQANIIRYISLPTFRVFSSEFVSDEYMNTLSTLLLTGHLLLPPGPLLKSLPSGLSLKKSGKLLLRSPQDLNHHTSTAENRPSCEH